MTKVAQLEHRFVTNVPRSLESGILYVSLEYTTMIHLCACGCEREVVTPLSPKDWKMSFDGETVSVTPSVGSWSLPCRSHYIIDHGNIRWAEQWNDEQIRRGRELDRVRKRGQPATKSTSSLTSDSAPAQKPIKIGPLTRFWRWLRGR